MKYEMEITLVVRTLSETGSCKNIQSIDTVKGKNLTEILGQFQLVLASVHRKLLEQVKLENRVIDDDIPF